MSGLEEGDGGVVIDRLGMHALDEAKVVRDLRGVGHGRSTFHQQRRLNAGGVRLNIAPILRVE